MFIVLQFVYQSSKHIKGYKVPKPQSQAKRSSLFPFHEDQPHVPVPISTTITQKTPLHCPHIFNSATYHSSTMGCTRDQTEKVCESTKYTPYK